MHNSFGEKFKITLLGESHSPTIGIKIDGVPANISFSKDSLLQALERRKSGDIPDFVFATTPRKEIDLPCWESGIEYDSKSEIYTTNGEPIVATSENKNIIPKDYSIFDSIPRPSHSDFVRRIKYGDNKSGGGISSGRMALPIVIAGEIAKAIIKVDISAYLIEIGGSRDKTHWVETLYNCLQEGDSVGGVVECKISGIKIGIGEPFFDSLESYISHIIFAIPGVKGIEFGNGFDASKLKGSQNNDCFISLDGKTLTNNSGGINGGISNGNDIIFRVAFKPTSSIRKEQTTLDFSKNEMTSLKIEGRHDVCFALRCPIIVESAAAIAIANLM